MTKFIAKKVIVLRFSDNPDNIGQVFPSSCHAIIPEDKIPIKFNHKGDAIGFAVLRRFGNKILADIELETKMNDTREALRLIRLLTPSIEADVMDSYDNQILGLKITGLSLCDEDNMDSQINPLGDQVQCATLDTKEGLH